MRSRCARCGPCVYSVAAGEVHALVVVLGAELNDAVGTVVAALDVHGLRAVGSSGAVLGQAIVDGLIVGEANDLVGGVAVLVELFAGAAILVGGLRVGGVPGVGVSLAELGHAVVVIAVVETTRKTTTRRCLVVAVLLVLDAVGVVLTGVAEGGVQKGRKGHNVCNF